MRALKIVTILMAVLIVGGTTALIVIIARRASAPAGLGGLRPTQVASVVDEPAGTRIEGIAAVQNQLALQLQGGGPDRVLLIDPATGKVAGRISLAR